ncbi:MAG: hypothetical protein HY758_08745 [Nitrospirae bacterium]|nr:hypothetical protein [Nitrospirota bacterium]
MLVFIGSADADTYWVNSVIDSTGDVGGYTSIAVDKNNKVHISYFDYDNADLKYATNKSGAWVKSTLDSAGLVGEFTSIKVDPYRNVHISYFEATSNNLKYALRLAN